MKITIFGTGYVGLVTGACLADVGHDVLCMDVDQGKIEKLKNGQIPIYEPGLEGMLLRNVEAGRLSFTTDAREAVAHGVLQFIAVGTPPDEDGSADLKYVLAVAESIGEYTGVKVHACCGGTAVRDDIRKLKDGVHVVIGTPNRVKEMTKKGFLKSDFLKLFILDEADEMLSRGFKDQIQDIFKFLPEESLSFSALTTVLYKMCLCSCYTVIKLIDS